MTEPCKYADDNCIVFDGKTLFLNVAWCPFLNEKCRPDGCPFAEDPKCQKKKEGNNA